MKKQTLHLPVSKTDYDWWVNSMKSHKTFVTPDWLLTLETPCTIEVHKWENGVATITTLTRGE